MTDLFSEFVPNTAENILHRINTKAFLNFRKYRNKVVWNRNFFKEIEIWIKAPKYSTLKEIPMRNIKVIWSNRCACTGSSHFWMTSNFKKRMRNKDQRLEGKKRRSKYRGFLGSTEWEEVYKTGQKEKRVFEVMSSTKERMESMLREIKTMAKIKLEEPACISFSPMPSHPRLSPAHSRADHTKHTCGTGRCPRSRGQGFLSLLFAGQSHVPKTIPGTSHKLRTYVRWMGFFM